MKTLFTYIFILLGWCSFGQSITAAEYFFDADNGVGTGTALAVDNNTGQLTHSYSISTTGLPEGFHSLYIRTKNNDNNWSLYHRETIYVKSFAVSNIVAAEYFFNADNGVGTGTTLTVDTNSGQFIQSFSIPTTGLSEGFHDFYFRTQDAIGNWSLYHREIIYIKDFNFIPSEVTNVEYFIDSDPGIGNGESIIFSDSSQSTQMLSFNTSGLTEGDHIFYIRGQNENGDWSIYESVMFTIDGNLGLEDSFYNNVTLQPNPFKTSVSINYSESLLVEKVIIYDINGRTVYKSNKSSKVLNLDYLSTGVYLLKLQANNKIATFKLVKQ